MSQLLAFAAPILPGKFEQWQQFLNKLNTDYSEEFKQSRKKHGVRERTFLQKAPNLDMVIVTMEGDNPMESFQRMANEKGEFSRWFFEQVLEIHGIDLRQPPQGPQPELILDSHR